MNLVAEFDRQKKNLIAKGYPELSGLSVAEFLEKVEPLSRKLSEVDEVEIDIEIGRLPFVIVVRGELVDTEKSMGLVEREGKKGMTKLFPLQPKDFRVVQALSVPEPQAYLLVDIDRGRESLNVAPSQAMEGIKKTGRLPLTIDEGVAIVTHFPEFLMKNNCFSLLGSRHEGDQRVPAIWINGQKQPNLGWCWNGNPHTWLGSASAGRRVSFATV